jgi:hypothetical protein
MPIFSRIFLVLSSNIFKVSDLTLRSLIQFELIFVQVGRLGSGFSPLHVDIQLSQHHLLKKLSFLQCILGDFV